MFFCNQKVFIFCYCLKKWFGCSPLSNEWMSTADVHVIAHLDVSDRPSSALNMLIYSMVMPAACCQMMFDLFQAYRVLDEDPYYGSYLLQCFLFSPTPCALPLQSFHVAVLSQLVKHMGLFIIMQPRQVAAHGNFNRKHSRDLICYQDHDFTT